MIFDDGSFWVGVVSGLVSTAILALARGLGKVVLSWLGLSRVGRAWGSKTTWRIVRTSKYDLEAILTFSGAPLIITAIVPVSGLARWAELAEATRDELSEYYLPREVDAGGRVPFSVRNVYDRHRFLRGFVYEISWFEIRDGQRVGFRAKARWVFSSEV